MHQFRQTMLVVSFDFLSLLLGLVVACSTQAHCIMSGIQCPASKGGDSHSNKNLAGRLTSVSTKHFIMVWIYTNKKRLMRPNEGIQKVVTFHVPTVNSPQYFFTVLQPQTCNDSTTDWLHSDSIPWNLLQSWEWSLTNNCWMAVIWVLHSFR